MSLTHSVSKAVSTVAALTLACACVSRAQVHSTADAPSTHVRLARADAAALTASFRTEGQTLVGQLGFTQNCAEETRQVTHSESQRTRVSAGWVAVGALGAASAVLGAYALSAASSADHTVTCGSGSGSPRAGDKCESSASSLTEAGTSALISGVGFAVLGGYMAAQTKQTERQALPDQTSLKVREAQPCGKLSALDGMEVAVLLPGFGGKWSGRVQADGTARIELSTKVAIAQNSLVDVFVESVPPPLAGVVAPGSVLAQVKLARR
jgi:hypothetical protein